MPKIKQKARPLRAFFMGFFLIVQFGGVSVFAQKDFSDTPTTRQAYQEILRLRLTRGRQLLVPELQTNGVAVYLDNLADVLQLLLTEDEQLFAVLSKREDQRLALLDKLDESSPYQRCLRAEIKLHWAFVKIKFGKDIAGAWQVIQAYKLLEENTKMFPGFVYQRKALGLLHVLIGSTPENYRWVTKALGLRGGIKKGMAELKSVADTDTHLRTEALLISYMLNGYVLKINSIQIADFERFIQQNNDNLLVRFLGSSLLMKEGFAEKSLRLIDQRPMDSAYLKIPFFELHRAEILLDKGQYNASVAGYQQFLAIHKGRNFYKDSYYKLYLNQLFLGNETAAKLAFERACSTGKAYVEADKVAQKACKAGFRKVSNQEKILLKARFATDGGYYELASQILGTATEASFTRQYDKTEFVYRKARIFHRSENYSAAIPYYDKVIQICEEGEHFGASSCLQLGYIYLLLNQKNKAKNYLEKAIAYPKHTYKNSVDNKARAALTELEN